MNELIAQNCTQNALFLSTDLAFVGHGVRERGRCHGDDDLVHLGSRTPMYLGNHPSGASDYHHRRISR